jgi:predicted Ser/Thr protein kinase
VDIDPAEARRQLEDDVNDDPVVRREVESLLDHHSRAGSFLAAPSSLETPGVRIELKPGSAVGPYTVVREIGHGGMGRVYLAEDTRLQRQVCLKVIRDDLAGAPQFRERLRREARLAASLSHPGICAVYALEEFEGHLHLVTEFVEGRTLRDEIDSRHQPSTREVFETMSELAGALAAAHAKGIAHRDLKPENVMRSTAGQLKILDFGLARGETDSAMGSTVTIPGMLMGTPAYMSPEQIQGGPIDRRTDLFALAVVMYEYATGRHPFAAQTPLATAARIVDEEPEPLQRQRPDLPKVLVSAIERCLRKSPADRCGTAEELTGALGGGPSRGAQPDRRLWWRLHQLAAVALYFTACSAAWLLKEWALSPVARWAFVLIGACSAINGVARGHLLFTERMHVSRLATEHQKARRLLFGVDLAIAVALVVVAGFVADDRPVAAVLVIGLAAGIGLAAVLIEPATNTATFDRF